MWFLLPVVHPKQYVVPVFIGFIPNYVFFMSYIVGSIFLTIHFKHFVFIEWFDLNSDSSSLFERPSIRDFLFDFLMCLRILFFSLKMLNFFSSGLILINTQSSSFSRASCLSISLLRFLSACPNSSLSIASLCLWK